MRHESGTGRIGSAPVAAVAAALALLGGGSPHAAERAMAVTFDDLPGPGGGLASNEVSALRENTRKLLAVFTAQRVPVVGFVNEGKLFVPGETPEDAEARAAILKMWVDAGFELGDHTYSHDSLNNTPLEERDLGKRRAFEAFLADRGYTIAPVTIDNDEYMYAAIYASALRRGDSAMAAKIGADYLRYMETAVAFCEELSRRLTGREIRQVLLLHANTLNADYFDRLAGAISARGYRYLPLSEALQDEAYGLPDTYVGPWGISWLLHWEQTAGHARSPSPDPPEWVTKAYEALPR